MREYIKPESVILGCIKELTGSGRSYHYADGLGWRQRRWPVPTEEIITLD